MSIIGVYFYIFICRPENASDCLNCSVLLTNSAFLWSSGLGCLFREKYTHFLLSWPTFKQALPHFSCLIVQPGAVGNIQRETRLRQRVLCFLVIHHQFGGAVHGAKNLYSEKEANFCFSPSICKFIKYSDSSNTVRSMSEYIGLIKCEINHQSAQSLHVPVIS